MAYSVLSKDGRYGNIIHFLADDDRDMIFITDSCDPGSTVMVLRGKNEGRDGVHAYMKAPSGKWVLYDGESDYKVPHNTAEVYVPADDIQFSNVTAGDLQKDMKFYPTGLVTGTLKKAKYPAAYDSDPKKGDKEEGHFFCAKLKTPPKATKYNMTLNEETTVKTDPADDWIMVCMEHIDKKDSSKTVKIEYDSGESFTFNLDYINLEE